MGLIGFIGFIRALWDSGRFRGFIGPCIGAYRAYMANRADRVSRVRRARV